MPLSVDNIIQQNTGSFEGTSGSVTLPVGTTAGSTVLILTGYGTPATGTIYELLTPSGFTQVAGLSGVITDVNAVPAVFAKRNISTGETSWTLSMSVDSAPAQVTWTALEVIGIGLDPINPWYASLGIGDSPSTNSNVSSFSSGTSPQTSCFDILVLALHVARSATTSVVSFSGQTNGFVELAESSNVNATNAVSSVVSYLPSLSLGTFSTTATLSTAAPVGATIIAIYADGANHFPDIACMFGAEIGTGTGLTSAIRSQLPPWDTSAGSPAVITTSPRSGNYCLELSSTSAAEYVAWVNSGSTQPTGNLQPPGLLTAYPIIERFNIYFPTLLPVLDVELASVEAGSLANGMVIWYRSASQKLGVKVGTDTEVLSDATVSPDQWIGVDYRYDARNTTHRCDWSIDYNANTSDSTAPVVQTSATGSGMTVTDITTVRKGWTTSRTATVRYDDIVLTKQWGAYPLGDHRVLPLTIDPAGTPTVNGSTANFKTFTSNGTLSTWNATNARNAVDEVPPTIGASSDGVTQVSVAIGDYVEFPMATYTAAPDNVLRALRWYTAMWAPGAQPNDFQLYSWDGIGTIYLGGLLDPQADDTTLKWTTHMQRNTIGSGGIGGVFYLLTQAKLDAMALRFGYSTDANPDIGIHNVFAELAIAPAEVIGIMDGEGGAFKVYVRQDPVSSSVISYLGTTPTGTRGMTMYGTVSGVDWSQYVGPNTTYEKSIGASSINDVTAIGMTPDPTV